jgi:hypothetical protein
MNGPWGHHPKSARPPLQPPNCVPGGGKVLIVIVLFHLDENFRHGNTLPVLMMTRLWWANSGFLARKNKKYYGIILLFMNNNIIIIHSCSILSFR